MPNFIICYKLKDHVIFCALITLKAPKSDIQCNLRNAIHLMNHNFPNNITIKHKTNLIYLRKSNSICFLRY